MDDQPFALPSEPIACSINATQKLTGLGRTKLYDLINDGALQTVRIGRRRLVLMKSIRALLDNDA